MVAGSFRFLRFEFDFRVEGSLGLWVWEFRGWGTGDIAVVLFVYQLGCSA